MAKGGDNTIEFILKAIAAGFVFEFIVNSRGSAKPNNIPNVTTGVPSDYIKKYYADAYNTQLSTGVPMDFTLSQGGLESDWGNSDLAFHANNDFGIKADANWKGQKWKGYRKYISKEQGYTDHSSFLRNNKRYKAAFNTTDPVTFAKAVAAAGYATDPNYSTKLTKVIALVQQLKGQLGLVS